MRDARTYPKLSLVEGAKIYAELKKEVEAAGILERAYGYYTVAALFAFGGFFLTLYLIIIAPSIFMTALLSLVFTFFAVQVGGFFHDGGHRAIFKSAKNNDIVGYIACGLLAYTFKKWRINHNRHHSNPNEEEMDPDIERPMFSFNEKQMSEKSGIGKTLSRMQTYLYYPVGSLTAIFTQIANIFYFIKEPKLTKFWEKLIYFVGMILWIGGPLVVLDLSKAFTFYLVVYPVLGLYLFNVFAPNHKGMPQIRKGTKISFLEHQIITARNLKGGLLTELFFIGLNYQIEHHLFTNCPRNKLKLITPYVKKICRDYGFEYTSVGIIETNKIIISELNKVALSA